MPSRRPHNKSRNGCVQCKARKIKCDERGPTCSNCSKKELACQFPGSAFAQQIPASAFRSGHLANIEERTDPTYNVKDLQLMHFFSTVTYRTFSDEGAQQELGQQVLAEEAFSHDFLMHALLAFAALHFIHVHPESQTQFAEIAIMHHDAALKRYMSALNSITRESCTAVFACSAILVYCAFVFPRFTDTPAEQTRDPIEEMLELFTMLRGVNVVIQASRGGILEGRLAPLLRNDFLESSGRPPEDIAMVLDKLEQCNEASLEDEENKTAYRVALALLRQCFGVSAPALGNKHVALSWPIVVSDDYMRLLRNREPMAVVILAHYGVVLHGIGDCWWAFSRGSRLVRNLQPLVAAEWSHLMEWPRTQTKDGMDG